MYLWEHSQKVFWTCCNRLKTGTISLEFPYPSFHDCMASTKILSGCGSPTAAHNIVQMGMDQNTKVPYCSHHQIHQRVQTQYLLSTSHPSRRRMLKDMAQKWLKIIHTAGCSSPHRENFPWKIWALLRHQKQQNRPIGFPKWWINMD